MTTLRCGTMTFAACMAIVFAHPAAAQSAAASPAGAATRVDSAIAAYDDLSYYAAIRHLRGALAIRTRDSLTHDGRSVALMYLVATEYFRNERDSAGAAARRLIAHDRSFAPDTLVFPPRVIRFYADMRNAEPPSVSVPLASSDKRITRRTPEINGERPTSHVPGPPSAPIEPPPAAVRQQRSGRDVALTIAFTVIAATALPPILAPGDDARSRRIVVSAVAVGAGLMRLFGKMEDEQEKRKPK